MFTSPRYLTRNVQEQVPVEIQLLLWEQVDEQRSAKLPLDYLQVCTFARVGETLKLIVEQEQPKRITVTYLPWANDYLPLPTKKIYLIDSVEYSTMLFAEEY